MATKYAGRTLTVSIDGGATTLPQLKEFGEFGSTRALIDASVYGEDWTSFVTGLQDGTEVDFVLVFDPADTGQQALLDIYNDTAGDVTLRLEHSESLATWDVHGVVTSVRYSSALNDLLQAAGSIKIVNPGVVFIES
jgi:hypothetical protein